MKNVTQRLARISAADLNDLVSGTSLHPTIRCAIAYRVSLMERLADRVKVEPSAIRRMATDALECVVVGLRNEFSQRAPVQGGGLWGEFSSRFSVLHPAFDNDAFAIYIGSLADAAHRLPSIIKGAFEGDPVREIGNTLAWLHLMPSTRTAAEISFDRLLSAPVTQFAAHKLVA